MSLSSSPLERGRMAIDSTGGDGGGAGAITGVPFGARVSPVVVSDSLATATRSPAGTSATGSCSLPRRVNRAWSRSSVWLRGLVSTASGRMVPDRTRSIEILPTYGSARVLKTRGERLAGGVARQLLGRVAGLDRDRRAVGGGGPELADVGGEALDGGALGGRPADDGEHARRRDAEGEGVLELLGAGDVALEVALHQVVVGDDDALHEVVVHLVLEGLHLVGDRVRCAAHRRRRRRRCR